MKIMLSKALVFAVIVLFIGAGVVPSISSDVEQSNNVIKDNDNNIGRCTFGTYTFYPTDDTTIAHPDPDVNSGYDIDIAIRNEYGAGGGSGWANDCLIRFDISSIPAGENILSATLKLYYRYWDDNNPAQTPFQNIKNLGE